MSGPLVYTQNGPTNARYVPVATRLALVLYAVKDSDNGRPSDTRQTCVGAVAYGLSSPNMLQMEPGQSFEAYAEVVYKTAEIDGIKPLEVWQLGMAIYSDWLTGLVPTQKEAEEAGTFPSPAQG